MSKAKAKAIAQIFIGIFIFYAGVSLYIERQADAKTKDWPETTGKIVEIKSDANFDGKGVTYEYKVDGQILTGHRVAFSESFLPKYWGSDKRSNWINEKYSQDQAIKVYYDPENVSDSVLLVEVLSEKHDGSILLILLGLGIIGVGFYLWRKAE